MKKTFCTAILAGAFLFAASLPMTAAAGGPRGGGAQGYMGRAAAPGYSDRAPLRKRLRDGSCLYRTQGAASGAASTSAKKRGNTYGPGDGSGHVAGGELPPKDGTGYGAPANR
jgi:hypothetical protein